MTVPRSIVKTSAVASAAAVLLLMPAGAHAEVPGGGDEQSSETSGDHNESEQTISAEVDGIRYDHSKNGKGETVGPVTPVTNWKPPACWFAPTHTPEEFRKLWAEERLPIVNDEAWVEEMYDKYERGKPYKDWNLDKTGEGMWWTAVFNSDPDVEGDTTECFENPGFWAANEERPEHEQAVDGEILSGLAYAQLRVPDTDISLSPDADGKHVVNLPTWAWLDESTFRPVSVTASVPELDLSATTTATPVSLKLEPGTEDAELHPASGECEVNGDGSIGKPYTKKAGNEDPPCGLTYLRASSSGEPYPFKATVTWDVSWTSSDGTSGELPSGSYGTTTELTVGEVQSVNR
ncbi:hypothetical protein CRI70_24225 [Streptomyces sp. Ru87]|nr:hypothetical protein CRI70_24225 [Streptomyces sp. Ru87]